MRNKIAGFTLAEVLITLTVIGVIAALTIPSLITNIQDAQYKAAWKKAYSDINQAANMVKLETGGTLEGLCPSTYGDCAHYPFFDTYFRKYLSVTKKCTTSNLENCVTASISNLSGSRTNLTYPYWKWGTAYVLSNGSTIWVYAEYWQDCTLGGSGYSDCSRLYIDTNGLKGPNAFGKDIFAVHVLQDGIKPFGSQGDWYGGGHDDDCSPDDQVRSPHTTINLGNNGLGCSAEYLYR